MNKTELQRRNTELEIAIILMRDAVKSESRWDLPARVRQILERVNIDEGVPDVEVTCNDGLRYNIKEVLS